MEKVLPQIDSIQELARFWDTHDLADFEDQLEEVRESVFKRSTRNVSRDLEICRN
ncbi:MAG: BrnA antitoxin family protein [Deltaproteobacteria bacterium]|nr:BrnA antitoxin family protein [Deltaproteobacteria bacterium]